MLPIDELRKLGWSEELIAAYETVAKEVPNIGLPASCEEHVALPYDVATGDTIDVSGEPVGSQSIQFSVG